MQLTDNFRKAMQDYIFLLEKKYPQKTIHHLVSTRYSLNHFERSILYRGITTQQTAEERKNKLITINKWNSGTLELWNPKTLRIDLFNILFTIAAYLRGYPVYLAMDGLLRDASESHDSSEWMEHLEKALDLLIVNLDELKAERMILYLDSPLPLSGYLAREIAKRAGVMRTELEIIRHESPDHLIRNATEGIIATSDSTIVDQSALPIFDIPHYLLVKQFEAKLLSLETI